VVTRRAADVDESFGGTTSTTTTTMGSPSVAFLADATNLLD
jgi:hypothetical protein